MALDALFVFRARATDSTTLSGSSATNTSIDLKNGTGHKNLWCVVHTSVANTVAGTFTTGRVYYTIQHSADDSTYYDLVSGEADFHTITASTATTGTVYIPFCTTRRYVRLKYTVSVASGSVTTLANTYEAYGTGVRPF